MHYFASYIADTELLQYLHLTSELTVQILLVQYRTVLTPLMTSLELRLQLIHHTLEDETRVEWIANELCLHKRAVLEHLPIYNHAEVFIQRQLGDVYTSVGLKTQPRDLKAREVARFIVKDTLYLLSMASSAAYDVAVAETSHGNWWVREKLTLIVDTITTPALEGLYMLRAHLRKAGAPKKYKLSASPLKKGLRTLLEDLIDHGVRLDLSLPHFDSLIIKPLELALCPTPVVRNTKTEAARELILDLLHLLLLEPLLKESEQIANVLLRRYTATAADTDPCAQLFLSTTGTLDYLSDGLDSLRQGRATTMVARLPHEDPPRPPEAPSLAVALDLMQIYEQCADVHRGQLPSHLDTLHEETAEWILISSFPGRLNNSDLLTEVKLLCGKLGLEVNEQRLQGKRNNIVLCGPYLSIAVPLATSHCFRHTAARVEGVQPFISQLEGQRQLPNNGPPIAYIVQPVSNLAANQLPTGTDKSRPQLAAVNDCIVKDPSCSTYAQS